MAETFAEAWPTKIWPIVKKDFEELLIERPTKQDRATGTHYGKKVITAAFEKGECRNIACNLAWTPPVENTPAQKDLSLDVVSRWVLDTYVDCNAVDVADDNKTEENTDVDAGAVSVSSVVATQSRDELLLGKANKPWMIPDLVPRGYNIPIAIHSADVEPQNGKFKRLGIDVAVNGTWLALCWARQEGNEDAADKLKKLILDWPFAFIYFSGDDDEREEKMLKWMINMPAGIERLRTFCGMGGNNLIRFAALVRDMLTSKTPGKTEGQAAEVHKWLSNSDNVTWGLYHLPTLRTVRELLHNWDTLKNNKAATVVMDMALARFGRGNLFDWPSKLAILITKSPDQASLSFMCEFVYAHMLRENLKDPFSANELSAKNGFCAQMLWIRRYQAQVPREFPVLFLPSAAASAAQKPMLEKVLVPARELLNRPLAVYQKVEGANRDPTFVNSLPSEAFRMYFKHVHDLQRNSFTAELKGALASGDAAKYNWAKFSEAERVKNRFAQAFCLEYSKLEAVPPKEEEKETEKDDQQKVSSKNTSSGAGSASEIASKLGIFRRDCETFIDEQLEARLVMLTADGTHEEIVNTVTTSRLYTNLRIPVRV